MKSQKKFSVGISVFHWCAAVTTRWYNVRSWGRGGRRVQAKEQTSACPWHWRGGSCGMQLWKARVQYSWVIFTESLLQRPERSTPIRKEVAKHSRTPVWLHRERLTETQHKTEAKPTRDGNGERLLRRNREALPDQAGTEFAKLSWHWNWYRTWRVIRRASTATSAVKAKGNMNLLLNGVGNLMKDTECFLGFGL